MRKERKGEKGKTPLFFQPKKKLLEKKNSLPLPIPLNKTSSFFKFIKTPTSLKKPFER